MAPAFDYDDLRAYDLDDEAERRLLESQTECTFIWSNREGWPVGVIMSFVWRDGAFWLSATSMRKRIRAVLRDPRVAICVSSRGSGVDAMQSVTYKGICEVYSDEATKAWFLPALASRRRPVNSPEVQRVVRLNDTPNRRVLKVTPTQRIGFDGTKMQRATAAAIERGDA